METLHLDTHIVVWLWQGSPQRVRRIARALKPGVTPVISPMVLFEIALLNEIDRFTFTPDEVLAGLGANIGLRQSTAMFASVARSALSLSWTQDPFDRLIVATAQTESAPLLTADLTILKRYPRAIEY